MDKTPTPNPTYPFQIAGGLTFVVEIDLEGHCGLTKVPVDPESWAAQQTYDFIQGPDSCACTRKAVGEQVIRLIFRPGNQFLSIPPDTPTFQPETPCPAVRAFDATLNQGPGGSIDESRELIPEHCPLRTFLAFLEEPYEFWRGNDRLRKFLPLVEQLCGPPAKTI